MTTTEPSTGRATSVRLYLFLACNSIGALAEPCVRFGVSWYVLQKTNSTVLFTLLFGLSLLSDILSRPFVAPMADHFNRVRVYCWASFASTLLCAALAAVVLFMPLNPVVIGALLSLLGVSAGLREVSAKSLAVELAPAQDLASAKAFQMFTYSTVNMAGPALAGTILALAGASAALVGASIIEAVSLVGAAAVYGASRIGLSASWREYAATWRGRSLDGLRCLWRAKAELHTAAAACLIHTGFAVYVVAVLPVLVSRDLQTSAGVMAVMEGCLGAGFLVGSALFASRANRWLGKRRASVVAAFLAATSLALTSIVAWLPAVYVLLVLSTSFMAVTALNTSTLRALCTPNSHQARMEAASSMLVGGLLPLATIAAGGLLQHLTGNQVTALCGLLAATGAALLARNRVTLSLMDIADEAVVGRYSQLYPRAFAEQPSR